MKEHYLEAHARVADRLPGRGVPWLARSRESALGLLAENGFPTSRHEDWRYTNLRPLQKQPFSPALPQHNGVEPADLESLSIPDSSGMRLVFVNGHFSESLSRRDHAPAGIRVNSLRQILAENPERVEPYFNRAVPERPHGFTAMNTAYAADGCVVELAPDTVAAHPIELLFLATGGAEPLVNQPRNLVIARDNSRATVVERYVGLSEHRYLTNAVTELHIGSGAAVQHYKLQDESVKAFHIGGLFIDQDQNSHATSHNISFGAGLARNDLSCRLRAPGGQCHLNGLYLGTGSQQVDNWTFIEHVVPRCASREFYKGILDGRARAVFQGRVVVHPGAQGTDAEQNNRNLLLSRDAEVDTKPQLEIYADDVKCAHGATVGQLDPAALFYLRSRGIPLEPARDLLTFAFASDVLNRIERIEIRKALEEHLSRRLLHGRRFEDLL